MKFYFVLELFTCCFFITPFIGAVPNIVKTGALVTGETVVLTCTISGYVLAEWKKGSSAALTTCTGGGSPSCSPLVSDRYTFSTTQNTITVSIDNLNRADDGTTWICNDAGAGATDNIVLDPILTQQSGIPTLTESSECQEITCESSCIAPFASSDGSFTWTYIPDGGTAQPLTNPSPTLSSSSDGCPSSEGKVKSTLTSINKPTGFKDNVKFQCDFSQNGFTSSWTATSNECFKADTPTPCCDCFCKVWCIVLVVIVIIYGTSWIVASVVNLVIYNMNQMRLPWHLCDGNLKKWQSWLLLFIFVPYVPSGVAIYLFNTKRPGYCRCVGAPGTDISINFKYTVSSSGEVTVQVKNEAGTILVSVKFIDGKVAGKADINPRVDFTRNVTTGDMSFKLNNIQTSDSGLYTLSGNDVPCSCVELFVTDKPTSGTEMNKFGPIRPLPPINPKKNSDPEKGSPRKLPEPPNPEDGNRLSPLQSNTLSNITETQQANGEQEKTKKKKKKKRKPKNNQVSDEEMEKSS